MGYLSIPKNYWISTSMNLDRQKGAMSVTPLPIFSGEERKKRIILTYVESS